MPFGRLRIKKPGPYGARIGSKVFVGAGLLVLSEAEGRARPLKSVMNVKPGQAQGPAPATSTASMWQGRHALRQAQDKEAGSYERQRFW